MNDHTAPEWDAALPDPRKPKTESKKMKLKDQLTEQTLHSAYQEGRVDALEGTEPTRYSAKPYAGRFPVPDGHCGCTTHQASIWDEMRQQYLLGFHNEMDRIETTAKMKP